MKAKTVPNFKIGQPRILGVLETTYKLMLSVVRRDYRRCKKSKGRNYRFGPEKRLEIFLKRLRYNDTFQRLADDYKISKSSSFRIFNRVLNLMLTVPAFYIKGAEALTPGSYTVDVTVIRLNRSKVNKIQKKQYSGKHKQHVAKVQVIIKDGIMIPEGVNITIFGSRHDFDICKETCSGLDPRVTLNGDSGYQGMEDLIPGSVTPFKKKKGKELTDVQKKFNKTFSSERIIVEHMNEYLKRFELIGSRYRGKISNLGCLKNIVKLICGFSRYELLSGVQFFQVICGTSLL